MKKIAVDTPETAKLPEGPGDGWQAGQGPGIVIVKGALVLQGIERAILWWETNYPDEVTGFNRQMDAFRVAEEPRRHYTRNRDYRHFADIPAKLYHRIGIELGCADWVLDPDVRQTFYNRFSDCLLDKHSPGTQRD